MRRSTRSPTRLRRVGRDAKEMLGPNARATSLRYRPMKDGVIANFEVTEKNAAALHPQGPQRHRPGSAPGLSSAYLLRSRRLNDAQLEDSAYRAKASEVYLVEEAMAAAIGAGLPITEPHGNMVVDIGGGTTDIAVISLSGIVYSRAVRVAGNEMDEAIISLHQTQI